MDNKMKSDHAFADAAMSDTSKLTDSSPFARGLIVNCKGRTLMVIVWGLEVFAILFQVALMVMELLSSCNMEFGMPHCWYCYTSAFLTWNTAWLGLWSINLYTFLLLVSRGFIMSLGNNLIQDLKANFLDRGIPRQGVVFFVA